MGKMKLIKIEVVSDPICPFCLLGKKRMERGMEKFLSKHGKDAAKFHVEWRPFFLDPSLPLEGVDKMKRYEAKFGAERMAAMIPRMKATGLEEGIKFSYGGKVANTLNAHRALEYALIHGGEEAQNTVVEEIMSNYHEQEKNLGDSNVLVEALKKGLPEESESTLKKFISSKDLADEVITKAEKYRSKFGISGVPFFRMECDSKHLGSISGAQDPEVFAQMFERA